MAYGDTSRKVNSLLTQVFVKPVVRNLSVWSLHSKKKQRTVFQLFFLWFYCRLMIPWPYACWYIAADKTKAQTIHDQHKVAMTVSDICTLITLSNRPAILRKHFKHVVIWQTTSLRQHKARQPATRDLECFQCSPTDHIGAWRCLLTWPQLANISR